MSLIAWWKLDNELKDHSGNNNDLIYYSNNGRLVPNSSGKIMGCYERTGLNNGSDYLRSTNKFNLSGSFTMACWAYVSAVHSGTANGLVTNHDHTANQGAGITVREISSTDFRISCNTGSGTSRTYNTYYGTSNIKDKWSHLLLRFDKSTNNLSLWVNGAKEYEITYAMSVVSDYIDLFSWSTTYTTTNYKPQCKLDDVRIYDHALTNKEIIELSRAKILHCTFDDFQETTVNKNNTDFGTWSLSSVTRTLVENVEPPIPGQKVYKFTANDAINLIRDGGVSTGPLDPNHTAIHTFSVYVKATANTTTGTTVYLDIGDYNTDFAVVKPYGSDWQRVSVTGVGNGSYHFTDIRFTHSVGNEILLSCPQTEEKDHATPFVKDSRIGVVKDCSGYEKYATLAIEDSPKWIIDSKIGRGAYEFGSHRIAIDTNFSIAQDQLTLAAWVYPTAAHSDDRGIVVQQNGNYYLTLTPTQQVSVYWYDTIPAGYHNTTETLPLNTWSHVATVWTGTHNNIYINGNLVKQTAVTTPGKASHTNPVTIGKETTNRSFKGRIDDVRIYSTALSAEDILELYQTRATIDDKGNLFANAIDGQLKYNNLLNYTTWRVGTNGSQTGFNINGTVTENTIITKANPWDEEDIVWANLSNDVTSDSDGGWNTPSFPIDKTKKYRYTIWIRREDVGNGRTYFGCGGSTVCNLSDGAVNGNPYFGNYLISELPTATNNWLLWAAHINPYDYSLTTSDPLTGIYTKEGVKIGNLTDYKWASSATTGGQRAYLYYSTSVNEKQFYYRPRVDVVDGTEPPLEQLLRCTEHRSLLESPLPTGEFLNEKGTILTPISEVGIVDGLIGWWPLNRQTVEDISGSGYPAVNYGTALGNISGKTGYLFNGTSNYIDLGFGAQYNGSPLTISLWVKLDNTAQKMFLSAGQSPDSNKRFYLGVSGDKWDMGIQNTAWTLTGAVAATTNLTHIVLTMSGSQAIMYADLVPTRTINYAAFGLNRNIWLGNHDNNYWFGGSIFDVRIYNRVLSMEEMSILNQLFNSQITILQTKDKLYLKGQLITV